MKRIVLLAILLTGFSCFGQVGVGTTTPLSTLDINGDLSLKVVYADGGSFVMKTQIDDAVYFNLRPNFMGSGNNDFELPNAGSVPGRIYILRNIQNCDNAFIYSAGGEFFAGNSRTLTAQPLTMEPDCFNTGSVTKTLIFVSDGINWTYGHLGF